MSIWSITSSLKDIAKIGLPAGFQGILFAISNIMIQSSTNSFGSDVMAGNSAIVNLSGFVYLAMSAFYSVGPTIVTLIGACALRIIWIETIFQIFRTPASLYVSNPISWGVTFAAHVVYYIIIRKKIVSLS